MTPLSLPLDAIMQAMDATWPAAEVREQGGWLLRRGLGGGKRVSAATRRGEGTADPEEAAAAMRAMGQTPLFMLTPDQQDLDADLAARGYGIIDPVTLYAAPTASIAPAPDGLADMPGGTVIEGEAPLAIMAELWSAGGIGPGRLAVMARTKGPRCYLLARDGDHPGGVAFVAVDRGIAMIHAVQVAQNRRRGGLGNMLTAAAARWAAGQGAGVLALATTDANVAANALYSRIGMTPVGGYHYRTLPSEDPDV